MGRNTLIRGILVSCLLLVVSTLPVLAQSYSFYPVTPCRVVDTRVLNPQQPAPLATTATQLPARWPVVGTPGWSGTTEGELPSTYKVRGVGQYDGTGNCGIPTTATAVALNVTIIHPGSNGDIRIWPYGGTMPIVSTINVLTTDTALANGAIVPLPTYNASNPDISMRFTVNPKNTGTDLALDVTGYFQ
jgi:hypothetical protein